ncbi:MAG: hypothetical protein OSB75_10160 [Dehalococcoidia bacterium]|nr:hypothetical protein [Dehalococcoidia bacterium]
MDSLEPELAAHPEKTLWGGSIVVLETEFVAEAGINHFDLAMDALKEMTKRFSLKGRSGLL